MDQRHLDRVWLGHAGGGEAAAEPQPGYEALVLDIDSSFAANTKLSQYDSPCADVSCANRGIIGFLSHRVCAQSTANHRIHSPHSITVHLLNYPALDPIAGHVLMHRGFGSPETNCDLATSGCVPGNPASATVLKTNDGPWTVALGHVDCRERMYSLMCSDSRGFTLIHLRSYVHGANKTRNAQQDSSRGPGSGRTVASVCIPTHCYAISMSLVPTNPTHVRLVYIHKSSRHVHILTLARTSLTLISETTIGHTKYYSHNYSPETQPDLLALGPMSGHMHVCNVHTGALVHTLHMPAHLSVAGQKALGATYRPLLAHMQERCGGGGGGSGAGQWMLEWVQGVGVRGNEQRASVTNKCHVHVLAPEDDGGSKAARVVAGYLVPPVQCSEVLGAHVHIVMSPNGDLGVVDLRTRGGELVGVWNVSAGFTRRVSLRQGVQKVREDEVRIHRVPPEVVGLTMQEVTRRRIEVEKRKRMTRGERAERRNRMREQATPCREFLTAPEKSESDRGESGGEEDADDALWTDAGDMVMLGEEGDGVLVVRGSVVVVLRRCVG
ncbi:hypothetical protein BCR44DRAFT_33904 [Catenaria anguillulae PL171]|uniref:Uncharacterized protein n=1 Tax=Catenaria anguillulae PL171 TaxID=765915 RepID=A0A1Y2HQH9_9FUNG|nr:hypothetical protein BCR44DRAFT_33904 [Catenaria anguillulae PL171]